MGWLDSSNRVYLVTCAHSDASVPLSFWVIEMTEFGLSDLVKAVDCKLEFNGMVFKCDNKE